MDYKINQESDMKFELVQNLCKMLKTYRTYNNNLINRIAMELEEIQMQLTKQAQITVGNNNHKEDKNNK